MSAPVSNASVLFAAGFQAPGAVAMPGDQTGAAGFEALLGMMLGQQADAQAQEGAEGQVTQEPAAQTQTLPQAAPQSTLGLLAEIRVSASTKDATDPGAAPQEADDAPVATTIENSLIASLFAPVPAQPPVEVAATAETAAQDIALDTARAGFPAVAADDVLAAGDLASVGEAVDTAATNIPTTAAADAPDMPTMDLKTTTSALAGAEARAPQAVAPRAQDAPVAETTVAQAQTSQTQASQTQANQTQASQITAANAAVASAAAQARPVERTAEPQKADRHAEADAPAADAAEAPNAALATATARPETTHAAKATGANGKAGDKVAGVETVATQEAASAPAEAQPADDAQPAIHTAETTSTQGASSSSQAAAHPVRGAPETVANLAAQIIRKLDARTTRFDLELDPIGLGQVDVRVEINAQGRVTAALAFDNPQAAAEVRSRASELQKALEQAGFDITGGMSFDVAGDQGRSGQNGRGLFDQESGAAFRGRAFQTAMNTTEAADTAPAGVILRRREAGVDVRI